VIVHIRFFLHLSFRGQQKEDLQLVLFTGFILFLMIGGTIWVLGDLYTRM
jgi:cytochrome o ubiquinol oxidase operon protein cyoD